jgi:hypothetical protein
VEAKINKHPGRLALKVHLWGLILPLWEMASPHDQSAGASHDDAHERENHTRLQQRLGVLNLGIVDTPRDGNCQFSAIAYSLEQLNGVSCTHTDVRNRVVQYIRQNEGRFSGFVDGVDFHTYCSRLAGNEWGDNITLLAACDVYNVKISVVDSAPGEQYTKHFGVEENPSLVLGHYFEFHYVATRVIGSDGRQNERKVAAQIFAKVKSYGDTVYVADISSGNFDTVASFVMSDTSTFHAHPFHLGEPSSPSLLCTTNSHPCLL